MRKLVLSSAAAWMAFVLAATPLAAQELSLSVLNAGKPVEAPVPVKVVEDGETRVVATADRGPTAVDAGIPTGTEVVVYVLDCEDGPEVVLVPRGEMRPDMEDCDDERAGIIFWGRDTDVSLDVGTGAISVGAGDRVVRTGDGYDRTHRLRYGTRDRFRFGVGFEWAKFSNLDDTGCGGLTSCSSDDSSIAPRWFLEYDLGLDLPVHVGLGARYHSYSIDDDLGGSDFNRVDVSVLDIGAYTGLSYDFGEAVAASFDVGFDWLRNDGDILSRVGGVDFADERDESGFRFRSGVSIDYAILERIMMRASASYLVGDEHDADTNLAIGIAAAYLFGGAE